jgi:hypothetical protein
MPRAQQNERSALCLLALLNLTPIKEWTDAQNHMIGITPMIDFARTHYKRNYAPNTRETFRRFSMHQLVSAGIALYNPDNPKRPVNSPKAVYQIEPAALSLVRTFGTASWSRKKEAYLRNRQTLAARYAKDREMRKLPVKLISGETIRLSPGSHSELIKATIEEFAPRFVAGGTLLYAGDTGEKWGYYDKERLEELGVSVDAHGKMPDVVIYDTKNEWLHLVEAVTSHGPVDAKRQEELAQLFSGAKIGLVYITAFPSRTIMTRYLGTIAWETEVWVADSPSHLIHFDGKRFLGPY